MTLPLTGPLSMSMINTELGRAATSLISLDSASNGVYATINTCSPYYPLATNPDKISEWYGYNHNAVCSFSEHSLDVTDQMTQNFIYGDNWSNYSTSFPDFAAGGFSIAFWEQMAAKGNSYYYITALQKTGTTGAIVITGTASPATLLFRVDGSSTSSLWTAELDSVSNSSITGIASGKTWGAGPSEITGSTNANNFTHLAFTFDSNQTGADQGKIYWNGQSLDISWVGDTVGGVTWSDQFLAVGGSYPSELAAGMYIDDYTFYTRDALTDGEIGEIYNGGEPQDPSGYGFSYDNILYLFETDGSLGSDTNALYDCGNSVDPPPVQSPEHA